MGSHSATGYVDDVPYAFSFTREVAPAWLDFVATLSGFGTPSRTGGFAWCELGCGQGVTAIVLAGTHPAGEFHGIDAYAPHIRNARRLSEAAGVTNLALHALDFASAVDIDLPRFDYIVAHGVYSWIDSRGREDLRRFVDRRLKPDGLVFVSYNAMPGWALDAPFQFLLREVAATHAGDSIAQFGAAMKVADALAAADAPALTRSPMLTFGVERLRKTLPESYFAHEFLPPAWQPLYVSQVRAEMAGIGLVPAGSGTVRNNFDSFVLRRAARDALAALPAGDLRELARDFFLNQRLRRDVFVRADGARRLGDEERSRRLAESVFDLQQPAGLVEYAMTTEAGRVDFANHTARAIVAALDAGPAPLTEVAGGHSRRELLASALALCAANDIRPVGPDSADVGRLNAALIDHVERTETPRFLALPHGTAVSVPPALPRALRDGSAVPDELLPWLEFLDRRGVWTESRRGAGEDVVRRRA